MVRRCSALSAAVLVVVLSASLIASAVGAVTQSVSSRHVVAAFSYRGTSSSARDLRLTIRVGGVLRYDEPVVARFCGHQCQPGIAFADRPSLHVRDLGPGNRRDVELDLFSGGAHCCTIEQVFTYHAKTKKYSMDEQVFGDPSATLVDLQHDGRYEFLSADDAFAYQFTDYAASGMPIKIVAFANGHFHDVTRDYPQLVVRDARKWMSLFRSEAAQRFDDSVGLVAAWAADEDLLGHRALVRRFLNEQVAAGHLKSGLSPEEPSGRAFVVALDRFLARRGYLA